MTTLQTPLDASPSFREALRVADAVLYEGYVLYPYRASAAKNQLRWQFGVLAPRPYAEAERSEAWRLQLECLVSGADPELEMHLRFLQVQVRLVERAEPDGGGVTFVPVASIEFGDRIISTWDEAVEHDIVIGPLRLADLGSGAQEFPISIAGGQEIEDLEPMVGRISRQRWPLRGRAVVRAEPVDASCAVRLVVEVENLTRWRGEGAGRDDVTRRSMISAHVISRLRDGHFVSLIDPSQALAAEAKACHNVGCFPVLCGSTGDDDVMLASPIILYDYPQIAPESDGDMCDATEIDEILAFRVLTLTDEEKREARGTDQRAAAIVDRCDEMSPETFDRLHGTIRTWEGSRMMAEEEEKPWWDPEMDQSVDPATDEVLVGSTFVRRGDRVVLRPSRRADAQDLFVAGKYAVIAGIFHDVDKEVHVAVTLEDDPGAEMNEWYGRYRYFSPDELELP